MNTVRRCLVLTIMCAAPVGCGSSNGASASGAGGAGGGSSSAGPGTTTTGSTANTGTTGANTTSTSGGMSTSSTGGGMSTAAQIAMKLGRPANFLVGMGNDLANDHSMDGAYTVGTTLDLHYAYLVGLEGQGGWPDWNAGGTFVNVLTDSADAKGVIPAFTLYAMAADGDGNLAGLTDDGFESAYWAGVLLLFQRLAVFDKPAVVHFEPDFWGYAEQQSKEDPTSMKVNLTNNAPDCKDLTNDLVGMGNCLVRIARMYAPKAIIGFHASEWASGDPNATVKFMKAVGADQADVVFEDLLDRDAGCFEAGVDPNCMRAGTFYWDESNQTSPNFHDYLTWAKTIGSGLGKPILWWQIPFGVPSATPGGTADHYRDNRVHYIFSHIDEWVAAGGLGVMFGTGAGNQTYITSDGGQFMTAVANYYKAPVALP